MSATHRGDQDLTGEIDINTPLRSQAAREARRASGAAAIHFHAHDASGTTPCVPVSAIDKINWQEQDECRAQLRKQRVPECIDENQLIKLPTKRTQQPPMPPKMTTESAPSGKACRQSSPG